MGEVKQTSVTDLVLEEEEEEILEENQSDTNSIALVFFEASLLSSVLEDTITQLKILAACNNELRIHKTKSDMGLLLANKFGVEMKPVTDELEGIDEGRLGCNEYKLNKLDADRKLLTSTMIDTYKDLCLSRTFSALTGKIQEKRDLDKYRESLQQEEAKNRINRREAYKLLRQHRNHMKTVVYDTEAAINSLTTEVEDSQLYAECRSRYIGNWQNARAEQHKQTILEVESGPSDSVEYYKMRSDHEQRIHAEVEILTNIVINETLQKVESWMDRYDKDMESIDLKIQIKKNDYQNALDKRVGLEKTIEKHDQLMTDWITFKDEREKARLYREKMTKSAIAVQAWWRGLLVRLQLGPYKPEKKKKKKK